MLARKLPGFFPRIKSLTRTFYTVATDHWIMSAKIEEMPGETHKTVPPGN
jgi:hypothetical protein